MFKQQIAPPSYGVISPSLARVEASEPTSFGVFRGVETATPWMADTSHAMPSWMPGKTWRDIHEKYLGYKL